MLFSPAPVTFFYLGQNILLSTLYWNPLRLCSSRNMRDKISHPYKTSEVIYLFVFILMFIDRKREDP